MIALADLSTFLDTYLSCDALSDYAPNGVQIEGSDSVSCIVSGVTASQALIERAVSERADAVLVHHGYFWKGEDPRLISMKKRRVELLMRHGISLLAYHLPLDVHAEVGNNVQFGRHLGWRGAAVDRQGLIWASTLPEPAAPTQFADHIARALGRAPLRVGPESTSIRRVMWCTGAAQKYLADAARLGADAFISGEMSEQTTHEARELGVHYFAAGHHATERYGIAALGAMLAQQFALRHVFVDIDNPA